MTTKTSIPRGMKPCDVIMDMAILLHFVTNPIFVLRSTFIDNPVFFYNEFYEAKLIIFFA
jgi:hypothetical protein